MEKNIEEIIQSVKLKSQKQLCLEVMSIGRTIDVLRHKWTVEILTAIVCGNTRFNAMLEAVCDISQKMLTVRLRQMQAHCLIDRYECYGYPPRVEYRVTEHGKWLFAIVCQMAEWGDTHAKLGKDLPCGK